MWLLEYVVGAHVVLISLGQRIDAVLCLLYAEGVVPANVDGLCQQLLLQQCQFLYLGTVVAALHLILC